MWMGGQDHTDLQKLDPPQPGAAFLQLSACIAGMPTHDCAQAELSVPKTLALFAALPLKWLKMHLLDPYAACCSIPAYLQQAWFMICKTCWLQLVKQMCGRTSLWG